VGGSSTLVIVGIWAAIIGYGVLYTGVQKLNGDPNYKLGMAFRGVAPTPSTGMGLGPSGAGLPGLITPSAAGAQQAAMIPVTPL
jgi:hypothetical protein